MTRQVRSITAAAALLKLAQGPPGGGASNCEVVSSRSPAKRLAAGASPAARRSSIYPASFAAKQPKLAPPATYWRQKLPDPPPAAARGSRPGAGLLPRSPPTARAVKTVALAALYVQGDGVAAGEEDGRRDQPADDGGVAPLALPAASSSGAAPAGGRGSKMRTRSASAAAGAAAGAGHAGASNAGVALAPPAVLGVNATRLAGYVPPSLRRARLQQYVSGAAATGKVQVDVVAAEVAAKGKDTAAAAAATDEAAAIEPAEALRLLPPPPPQLRPLLGGGTVAPSPNSAAAEPVASGAGPSALAAATHAAEGAVSERSDGPPVVAQPATDQNASGGGGGGGGGSSGSSGGGGRPLLHGAATGGAPEPVAALPSIGALLKLHQVLDDTIRTVCAQRQREQTICTAVMQGSNAAVAAVPAVAAAATAAGIASAGRAVPASCRDSRGGGLLGMCASEDNTVPAEAAADCAAAVAAAARRVASNVHMHMLRCRSTPNFPPVPSAGAALAGAVAAAADAVVAEAQRLVMSRLVVARARQSCKRKQLSYGSALERFKRERLFQ